ncbi:MAG: hypothetical protein LLG04_16090 [Parachlamydia sp.]|nr:hypothetical protein [Parachlamydia sp.]
MKKNKEKFDHLRSFRLPLGQYAIISSGPLGIRNLREIKDIDLIVTPQLWDTLAARFGIVEEDGVRKIRFAGDIVEAFTEGSFADNPKDAPTLSERIASAEIIDNLPFESLPHVLFFKRYWGREKDLIDIQLIEAWLYPHGVERDSWLPDEPRQPKQPPT